MRKQQKKQEKKQVKRQEKKVRQPREPRSESKKEYIVQARSLRPPTLYLPSWLAYELAVGAVEASPYEIGWLGQIHVVQGGLYLNKVYLVKQKTTGATFEWDEQAYDEWYQKIAMDDLWRREHGHLELSPLLGCVVHSHVQMGTFFSGTDEEVNNSFINRPWMVALVLNTKGEYKAQIVYQEPIIAKRDLTVKIADTPAPGLRPKQEIIAEVKEKTAHANPTVYSGGSSGYSGYDSYGRRSPGSPGGGHYPYDHYNRHQSRESKTEGDQQPALIPLDSL